jgi:hypothetical protein
MDVLMRVNSYRQASREFRDTLYHSGERLMDMGTSEPKHMFTVSGFFGEVWIEARGMLRFEVSPCRDNTTAFTFSCPDPSGDLFAQCLKASRHLEGLTRKIWPNPEGDFVTIIGTYNKALRRFTDIQQEHTLQRLQGVEAAVVAMRLHLVFGIIALKRAVFEALEPEDE